MRELKWHGSRLDELKAYNGLQVNDLILLELVIQTLKEVKDQV